MFEGGDFVFTFPESASSASRCGGNLKPCVKLELQAKSIGFSHRQTGLVFQSIVCAVLWGSGLPNTVFPIATST